MTITRYLPALVVALAAGLALPACSPAPSSRNAAELVANTTDTTADEIMAVANAPGLPDNGLAADNGVAAKSILRPEIVEPEPTPPPLEPIQRTISFATSGMALDDDARQALDALLADPVVAAGGRITLRGHSDSRGHDGDNLVASRKRAAAVQAYLVDKGVAADRITLVALGEARPTAPNAKPDGSDDPEGRAKNRRVEIDVALPARAPSPSPTPSPRA